MHRRRRGGRARDARRHRAAERCERDDLLIVFFAGHGVRDQRGEIVLATSDLAVEFGRVRTGTGLRLADLARAFRSCKGHSILMLDTCFSGNYADTEALQRAIVRRADPVAAELDGLDRHYAILSCRTDAASREDPIHQHGWFTHYVLRALSGDAPDASNRHRQVTAQRLFMYVYEESDHQPPTEKPCSASPQLVLSRLAPTSPPVAPTELPTTSWIVRPVSNPIEMAEPLVATLGTSIVRGLRATTGSSERLFELTESIRVATGATEARVVLHSPRGDRNYVSAGPAGAPRWSSGADPFTLDLAERLASGGHRSASGFLVSAGDERGATASLAVPRDFRSTSDFDFLVLDGLPEGSPWRTDVGATLIHAAFEGGLEAVDPDVDHVDGLLFDALRATFGRVPSRMYERRFELFAKQLERQSFVFEPIVQIGRNVRNVQVSSWEALARDPDHPRRAPHELFTSAELWGSRFLIELDSVLLDKAVHAYAEAYERAFGHLESPPPVQPIAVNAYPESVLSEAYCDSVLTSMVRSGVGGSDLIIELSEKRPLPRRDDADHRQSTVSHFSEALDRFMNKVPGVSFAIDDFGVGHASLDRLARLRLAHVKIDRDVLFHETAREEVALVVRMTRSIGRAANKIVAEGFDSDCPLTLEDLYDCGIRYVQGWFFPMAAPYLADLPVELRREIAAAVRGSGPDSRDVQR